MVLFIFLFVFGLCDLSSYAASENGSFPIHGKVYVCWPFCSQRVVRFILVGVFVLPCLLRSLFERDVSPCRLHVVLRCLHLFGPGVCVSFF